MKSKVKGAARKCRWLSLVRKSRRSGACTVKAGHGMVTPLLHKCSRKEHTMDYSFTEAITIAHRIMDEQPDLWHGDDQLILTSDSSL